ncbi:MAG: GNAT family N-acetyltransferase, partial [Mesorhizobium sp.]
SPADEPAILALNNEHAAELSWLEPERLSFLLGEAFYTRRIGALGAFILCFDQDANYDSPNFFWFRERYPRFVYVDRVVVAAAARGRG